MGAEWNGTLRVMVILIFLGMIYGSIRIVNELLISPKEYAAQYEQSYYCNAMGGKWYKDENLGCQKEYQSCGPDENKPGYTICEQKFKRVYPENP